MPRRLREPAPVCQGPDPLYGTCPAGWVGPGANPTSRCCRNCHGSPLPLCVQPGTGGNTPDERMVCPGANVAYWLQHVDRYKDFVAGACVGQDGQQVLAGGCPTQCVLFRDGNGNPTDEAYYACGPPGSPLRCAVDRFAFDPAKGACVASTTGVPFAACDAGEGGFVCDATKGVCRPAAEGETGAPLSVCAAACEKTTKDRYACDATTHQCKAVETGGTTKAACESACKDDDGFPVWGIVLIAVGGLLALALLVAAGLWWFRGRPPAPVAAFF